MQKKPSVLGVFVGVFILLIIAILWVLKVDKWLKGRSNCAIWAGNQWVTEGGHISFRRSDWGWYPHCTWSPDRVNWYGYTTDDPSKRYSLLFKGYVKKDG